MDGETPFYNASQKPAQKEISKKKSFWSEYGDVLFIFIFVFLPIRFFVIQPFIVDGRSMSPTFETGQYVIIDEISYRFHEPKRDDVIVFRYPIDPSRHFIKRIIGLPGETITINKNTVTITTVDKKTITLQEPYVVFEGDNELTKTLGAEEYFVLGDNRKESFDSRSWGVLPKKNITGRALVRLFPLSTISLFPGNIESFSKK